MSRFVSVLRDKKEGLKGQRLSNLSWKDPAE